MFNGGRCPPQGSAAIEATARLADLPYMPLMSAVVVGGDYNFLAVRRQARV